MLYFHIFNLKKNPNGKYLSGIWNLCTYYVIFFSVCRLTKSKCWIKNGERDGENCVVGRQKLATNDEMLKSMERQQKRGFSRGVGWEGRWGMGEGLLKWALDYTEMHSKVANEAMPPANAIEWATRAPQKPPSKMPSPRPLTHTHTLIHTRSPKAAPKSSTNYI